eukprot:TRINITY_DN69635_c0_g1_i1.p1 TRINITY_DN69635_c0_g1~~TRINITY_DN69635_c0_g1_i1.p1  ORF type:complete len:215 (-),score=43.15 TRINITY_DN69635_c0_g1_i1:10-654(-)
MGQTCSREGLLGQQGVITKWCGLMPNPPKGRVKSEEQISDDDRVFVAKYFDASNQPKEVTVDFADWSNACFFMSRVGLDIKHQEALDFHLVWDIAMQKCGQPKPKPNEKECYPNFSKGVGTGALPRVFFHAPATTKQRTAIVKVLNYAHQCVEDWEAGQEERDQQKKMEEEKEKEKAKEEEKEKAEEQTPGAEEPAQVATGAADASPKTEEEKA